MQLDIARYTHYCMASYRARATDCTRSLKVAVSDISTATPALEPKPAVAEVPEAPIPAPLPDAEMGAVIPVPRFPRPSPLFQPIIFSILPPIPSSRETDTSWAGFAAASRRWRLASISWFAASRSRFSCAAAAVRSRSLCSKATACLASRAFAKLSRCSFDMVSCFRRTSIDANLRRHSYMYIFSDTVPTRTKEAIKRTKQIGASTVVVLTIESITEAVGAGVAAVIGIFTALSTFA